MPNNFNKKSKELTKYAKQLGPKWLKAAIALLMDNIGVRAVKDHMITTTSVQAAIEQPVNAKKLTMRTGRLAGSILGSFRFSVVRLPSTVEKFRAKGFKQTGLPGTNEGIREIMIQGSKITAIMGSEVPYAAKHEYGKETTPARPYLNPAINVEQKRAMQIFEETIEATFRQANI